jgi:cytidylate kinase
MTEASPFVVAISRQIGSGGAYLGKRLATRLNVLYLDREIVSQAAKELKMSAEALESRDEKLTPAWQSLLESYAYVASGPYIPPPLNMPTDRELYTTESKIITRIAGQHSAVIVGRGGYYVLRRHPRYLSVLLHAEIGFRQRRVQELYHVSAGEALKIIESIDRKRERYLQALTGQNCMDARQYHLSINTSIVGLEEAEEIILAALRARFGDTGPA